MKMMVETNHFLNRDIIYLCYNLSALGYNLKMFKIITDTVTHSWLVLENYCWSHIHSSADISEHAINKFKTRGKRS